MAGKNPRLARAAFLEPLQRALSCASSAVIRWRPLPVGDTEALAIGDGAPLALRCNGSRTLFLTVRHEYALVRTDDPQRGPWKVETRAYFYRLDDAEHHEIVSWHWHPRRRSREQRPHLHVNHRQLTGLHLPSGRVSLESVLRMLLAEFGVRPCRTDWKDVLDATEAAFVEWRTWG